MRFSIGAAITALAAVAAAVPSEVSEAQGKVSPQAAKHMKGAIMSLTKSLDTKNCDTAKPQVKCLQSMLQDYADHGHVQGEKASPVESSSSVATKSPRSLSNLCCSIKQDAVTYITIEDGDTVVKELWNIRDEVEHRGRDDYDSDDESSLEGRDEASLDSQKKKGGKGRFRGGKGRKGKGRKGKGRGGGGIKGGMGGSQGGMGGSKGGYKGRGGSRGRSLDEEATTANPFYLSCNSAFNILKAFQDFAPKAIKMGVSEDDKLVYYVYPKEEKALKSKLRKAVLSR